MNKRTAFLSAIMILFFCVATAQAEIPSSKGSAAIGTTTVISQSNTQSEPPATNLDTDGWDNVLSTVIQVAQQKELAFDVALQCGLFTDTLVKSKGGTKDTSTAETSIDVRVKLQRLNNAGTPDGLPFLAFPTSVTYAKRQQNLMAKFQGIFQECETYDDSGECSEYGTDTCLDVAYVDTDGDSIPDDYVTTLDLDCLGYEELQLMLNTVNANAFNFVSADLEQGEYRVTVQAKITSSTSAQEGSAEARGVIGLGSMLVDEVRFIKTDTDPTIDTGM